MNCSITLHVNVDVYWILLHTFQLCKEYRVLILYLFVLRQCLSFSFENLYSIHPVSALVLLWNTGLGCDGNVNISLLTIAFNEALELSDFTYCSHSMLNNDYLQLELCWNGPCSRNLLAKSICDLKGHLFDYLNLTKCDHGAYFFKMDQCIFPLFLKSIVWKTLINDF